MTVYVRQVMTQDLATLKSDETVESARKIMDRRNIRSVLIPPSKLGRTWRIFTYTDLLIALNTGEDPNELSVGAFASPITVTAKPNWELEKARAEMVHRGVQHLPVTDDRGNVIGMVSSKDVVSPHFNNNG